MTSSSIITVQSPNSVSSSSLVREEKNENKLTMTTYFQWNCTWTGAHHWEPTNTPFFLPWRFHRPIYFRLNLSRIQIPMGTSVTNCNHEHGLMSTCSREAALFNPKGCWCTLELAYFTAKISKNRLLCKNAVALACYGSRRLLGMGSWLEAIELE